MGATGELGAVLKNGRANPFCGLDGRGEGKPFADGILAVCYKNFTRYDSRGILAVCLINFFATTLGDALASRILDPRHRSTKSVCAAVSKIYFKPPIRPPHPRRRRAFVHNCVKLRFILPGKGDIKRILPPPM